MPADRPRLPLRVHDSATGRNMDFVPREPGKVSMYVCGPTVAGAPHVGHGRFTLVFDIIRRYLIWSGFDVTYVSNITDVDDKIIARAATDGRATDEVVAEYETLWWRTMDRLGVLRPDVTPHATAYIGRMVTYIAGLVDAGSGYVTADGVYLDTGTVDDYGLLAHQDLDALVAGGGDRTVVGAEHKRSPLDFAVWKFAKPGEPAWPSPWGAGRPGWHIECTVMSLDTLGDGFDIHGGGDDLRFPHHENERAQASATGRDFARYWLHNGMVVVDGGQKMGKSLGNARSLPELLDATDPRAYRMLVARSKYRSPVEVTAATLADAAESVRRLDALARRVGEPRVDADTDVVEQFRSAMNDDFNTPAAVAVIFDAVRAANTALDRGDRRRGQQLAAAVLRLADVVGLRLDRGDCDELSDDIAHLVAQRDEARAAKDWAASDRIRAELTARGWTVQDTPHGTRLTR